MPEAAAGNQPWGGTGRVSNHDNWYPPFNFSAWGYFLEDVIHQISDGTAHRQKCRLAQGFSFGAVLGRLFGLLWATERLLFVSTYLFDHSFRRNSVVWLLSTRPEMDVFCDEAPSQEDSQSMQIKLPTSPHDP